MSGVSEVVWSDILFWYDSIQSGKPSVAIDISKLSDTLQNKLMPLMVEFRNWGICVASTFQFWDIFLQAL